MLPKPGKDHSLVGSHRPIMLLPTISKLTERIVKSRIDSWIAGNNDDGKLLSPFQCGFRSNRQTKDAGRPLGHQQKSAPRRHLHRHRASLRQGLARRTHLALLQPPQVPQLARPLARELPVGQKLPHPSRRPQVKQSPHTRGRASG